MFKKRKTAGELSLKAASDSTKYDYLEVSHAICDDILEQVHICIDKHKDILNEPEFCVVMVFANDPLIQGVKRKKFYPWLYLPSPRPEQVVFLYRKVNDSIIRLWSLPNAKVMSIISDLKRVDKKWRQTKGWCDAFYYGWKYDKDSDKWINTTPTFFYEYIRREHDIDLLSESEYLNANREKLIEAGCKEVDSTFTDPFDFSKVSVNKIVDTKTAILD